jgi:hypothetical protein
VVAGFISADPFTFGESMAGHRPSTYGASQPGADVDDDTVARGLTGYVRAVAGALNLGVEATGFEVSDTATAYLALAVRSPEHFGRDLMLVWTELHGWALAVETAPSEQPEVLAYLGADPIPGPRDVAGFVDGVLAGPAPAEHITPGIPPDITITRRDLGARLTPYVHNR